MPGDPPKNEDAFEDSDDLESASDPPADPARTPNDITDILIRRGILDPARLEEAKSLANQTGVKFPDALVKLGYCTPQDVTSALAEFHGLPFVDLTEVTIPPAVIELLPESVARESVVLPLSQEAGALTMIVSDPTDSDTLQKLQFILNKEIRPVLAAREQIVEAINRHYGQSGDESVDAMLAEFTDDAVDFDEPAATLASAARDDSDPFVRLVQLIIQEAVALRASEVHIEPFADRIRVRYRIDGQLVERDSPPRRLLDPLLSRIKFLSNLAPPAPPQPRHGWFRRLLAPHLSRIKTGSKVNSPEERPHPRAGRITTDVSGRTFDLRVRVLPTVHGESVVLRILDPASVTDGLRNLGMGEELSNRFRRFIHRPNGLVLLTGPGDSGKTTTLYAALTELNRPDRKIITAEDPVGYYLSGVNQVEVRPRTGLDLRRVLREALRQEPDVLAVGAIRDRETARTAVQAALGGCMVLGTLHNSGGASGAITRLFDLGVEPLLVAGSVAAVLAQRLVRVVCPQCKEPEPPNRSELHAADVVYQFTDATFMRGRGCGYCNHTGYRGRSGIFELLEFNAAIREMTFNRDHAPDIRRRARSSGMCTLLEDGLSKAAGGTTTLEEVLRVCRHEIEPDGTR
jgi:type IV pilus assembly protein PilB